MSEIYFSKRWGNTGINAVRDREIVWKTRITSFQQLEHDGPASTALTKFIWQHQKSQLKLFSSNFQFGNRVGTQKSKLFVDHKVSITWRDQRAKWDQSEIQLTRMAFSFRSCRIMDRFTIVFSYVTLSRYFQFFTDVTLIRFVQPNQKCAPALNLSCRI